MGLMMWDTLSDERTGLWLSVVDNLASSVLLGSESRGTHDHILLPQFSDSTNLVGRSLS
jgi:hypothetical protein